MSNTILTIFAALLAHSTDILAAGEQMFNDIAHGEGGVEKVQKVAGDLAQLSLKAAGVAATVQAAQSAPQPGATS